MATTSPTTVTVHPTTNYPGVDSTGTTSSTSMSGKPMSGTVSTTHVQHNTTTSSTSTATNRPTTVMTNIPTTTLAPTTQNSVGSQILNPPPDLIFHVAVKCIPGNVTVVIMRGVLLNNHIQESSLYLGKPECRLSGGNSSHVWLTTSWEKCGTKLAHVSPPVSLNSL